MLQVLRSLGVAAPAGFNAYLALLLVGLAGRFGWLTLQAPYDQLEGATVLIILVVLLTIEVVVDKIPALDTVNDMVGTVVRPASGAILFAGTNNILTDRSVLVSLILGAIAAGSLHSFKAGTRPIWTLSTAGLANPVVSVFEDLLAGTVVIMAIFAPVLAIALLLIVITLGTVLLLRLRNTIRHRRGLRS